jgi:4-hydroxy-2-oxoheptanedioate aldolase
MELPRNEFKHAINEEEARRFIDWGYKFVAVGTDHGMLARHADALARRFKDG